MRRVHGARSTANDGDMPTDVRSANLRGAENREVSSFLIVSRQRQAHSRSLVKSSAWPRANARRRAAQCGPWCWI
jgi:hypothetical protein